MRALRVFGGVLVSAVIFIPAAARACFESGGASEATVRFLGPGVVEVAVLGFKVKATGLSGLGTEYCALALGHAGPPASPIAALLTASVTDTADPPEPLAALSFAVNATTTAEVSNLQPTALWQGFLSPVVAAVTGATAVRLVFTAAVTSGTSFAALATALTTVGLVASDDATALGTLVGTAQVVEQLSAVVEVPDCSNDVLDSGEVCDTYANLGCMRNEHCYQCSLCVDPGPAASCKAWTLKKLARGNKKELGCHARAARKGSPADPQCLAESANLLNFFWIKLDALFQGDKCPLFPSYPADAAVDALVNTLGTDVAALVPLGTTSGAWRCAGKKMRAAAVRATNKLACHVKASKYALPVDPTCLLKADTRFAAAMARAEIPGLCDPGNLQNAGTVAAVVDSFVNAIVTAVP